MVADSPSHQSTGVVMLDSKSNKGHKRAIIFRNCALNLEPKKNPSRTKQMKKTKLKINVNSDYFNLSKGDQKALF